jgi:hypothetical protein
MFWRGFWRKPMSDATDGIDGLNQQFQRFCNTQPNEGHRLSLARTKFTETLYWLRMNHDVHQARIVDDGKHTTDRSAGAGSI